MFGILLFSAFLVFGFIAVVAGITAIVSLLPQCVQNVVEGGCGCLAAVIGSLIVVVPFLLFVLWVIGTFL